MTKGFHKKNSKRVPAKRRYKIEKKVREHNKKIRKQVSKTNFKKKTKDPGIPNSVPFKDQILSEIQEHKKQAEQYREMVKAQLKQNCIVSKKTKANQNVDLKDFVNSAEKRQLEFDNNPTISSGIVTEKETSNLKTFYKEFIKVVEASDIIIEVLDSRDPLGSRCHEVENIVLKNSPNKRIILLLNKADLIPRENLHQWVKYFQNEFPTVPFKSCTQNQKNNLGRSKSNILLSEEELSKSSKCFGADFLMKLLNKYCHNKNLKTAITVGVVGFPNVGKSSIINSLKRTQVCNVGASPGLTKSMQTISLDKHIKLLDCPGVVFAKNSIVEGNQQMSSILALRNAIKIESLSDPILPIEALLNRVNRKDLMTFYRLTEFNTVKEFLMLVAKRFGKMLKGGILDLENAAKKVLQDWNSGKIKYFTLPPAQNDSTIIDTQIVSEMAKEFDINDFVYNEMMQVYEDQKEVENAFVIKSFSDGLGDEMVTDAVSTLSTRIVLEPSKPSTSSTNDVNDVEMEELEGMQLNKSIKNQFKKQKKQRKRDAKLSNKLDQINLEEDYKFDDYF